MRNCDVLIVLVVTVISSCSSPRLSRQLDAAESLMNECPDSSLAIIRSIDTLSIRSKSAYARYSLLHSMALDKNYIDTTNLSVIQPAVDYYNRHGSAIHKFQSLYYLGRIQCNRGDFNGAAISFSRAESIVEEVSDNESKGLLYMAFAQIYNKTRNKEKEEKYVKKGIRAFELAGDVKHGNLSSGRLAVLYYGKQEWGKADSLFKVGIEQAKEDTVAMSVFLSNYARFKVVQPNPDPENAIKLLKDLVSLYKQPLSLTDYCVWAYASALIGDYETCSRIESQLENLDGSSRNKVLYWLYRIEQNRGNYEKALAYNIESNANNSETIDQLLSDSVEQSLHNYYAVEAQNLKRDAHIFRLRMTLVLLGICIALILLLAGIRNRQLWKEKETERLLKIGEETNKLLKQSNEDLQRRKNEIEIENFDLHDQVTRIKLSTKELEDVLKSLRSVYVSTYKDKFSAIGDLCNAYIDSNDRTDRKEFIVRKVENLIAFIGNDDKLHSRFENQINKDLNNIVKRLKADLGNVDKKESRFICYCIVGFTPEMIGSILGLSISNVYTKKSRLKDRIRSLDSPYREEYLMML